jgi:hypothetical protein
MGINTAKDMASETRQSLPIILGFPLDTAIHIFSFSEMMA